MQSNQYEYIEDLNYGDYQDHIKMLWKKSEK